MIVDSSALVAILLREPEAVEFAADIVRAPSAKMSAVSYFEVALRIDTPQTEIDPALDLAIAALGIDVVPFTAEQAHGARAAHARFGRARHPAKLNFGDCMTYALAHSTGEPLLFKGKDFVETDLPLVRGRTKE